MSDLPADARFGTRALHAGLKPDPTTGSIRPPVYQTSTYVQPGLGNNLGYEYARTQNPTREALERNIAALEGAAHGVAFASGLAAIDAMAKLLSAGDHVVCGEGVYGGTFRLFNTVMSRLGIEFTFVDSGDSDAIRQAVRPETKLIHVETPTNPMMRLTDLSATAEIAKAAGAWLSVDNTFATPFNQRPLEMGADMVIHSMTKYLNGHSDMVGGIVVTSDDEIDEQLRYIRNTTGGIPGPWDCWLVIRGTKTLHLRMRQHNQTGQRIAEWLEEHPAIERVFYPGLPSFPQHELAKRQMTGFTGMISVETGSLEAAKKLVEGVRIFALAESLGCVQSLISHPAMMTHASVPVEHRRAIGISDGLVRLSCGIEETEDLIADLEQALA